MSDVKPGDHIIIEGYRYDTYIVARVVKVGKAMWDLEILRHNGEYDRPARRKVYSPLLYVGNEPVAMANPLHNRSSNLWAQQQERKRKYHEMIRSLPGVEATQ